MPYPSFWFDGRRVFGHRWAAEHIHGLDIEGFHVDHCCPHIPIPNTLCVQHLQALTPRRNRELQYERRRNFIHLQVGLVRYEEMYGHPPGPAERSDDEIPFYEPPAWLGLTGANAHDRTSCPF